VKVAGEPIAFAFLMPFQFVGAARLRNSRASRD
jgi:hypothetical protein